MNAHVMKTSIMLCGALALAGCGGDGLGIGPKPMTVQASLSGVTLAYDCGANGAGASSEDAAPCQTGFACPGVCQQSNMQLALTSSAGTGRARIIITAVRIVDPATGKVLDDVSSREPRTWASDRYQTWDEQVAPSSSLTVSYNLSAPDWAVIESQTTGLRSSGAVYRIEVEMLVDGVARILKLDGVTREPEVAT
jgi:hypothetical protein